MAAVALAVAVAACSWYLLAPGGSGGSGRSAEDRFVDDVRAQPIPPSLRRASEADLVALGERFCEGLRRRGSSLAVLLDDQLAGRVYDGQTQVVASARRHLCPELPDRD